jgi:hypothetical protein
MFRDRQAKGFRSPIFKGMSFAGKPDISILGDENGIQQNVATFRRRHRSNRNPLALNKGIKEHCLIHARPAISAFRSHRCAQAAVSTWTARFATRSFVFSP